MQLFWSLHPVYVISVFFCCFFRLMKQSDCSCSCCCWSLSPCAWDGFQPQWNELYFNGWQLCMAAGMPPMCMKSSAWEVFLGGFFFTHIFTSEFHMQCTPALPNISDLSRYHFNQRPSLLSGADMWICLGRALEPWLFFGGAVILFFRSRLCYVFFCLLITLPCFIFWCICYCWCFVAYKLPQVENIEQVF